MKLFIQAIFLVLVLVFSFSCNDSTSPENNSSEYSDATLFTLLSADETGIVFQNELTENPRTDDNILSFPHFFLGGGVGIGDLNNDGLPEVFLTGNQVPNKLFLNKGNMQFEDISATANINENKNWSTGVSMADVNDDGWLDIYVCQSGPGTERRNTLYINNGDLTFTESAAQYGLDDGNESIQAAFFDYDKDGDLDCYVMNESKYVRVVFAEIFEDLKKKENLEAASGNLYRNDGGKFTKVTEEAGMLRYGFGLGLVISDINKDGWPDVYVANDYSVPDFMYINNGDGTFTDEIKARTKQISFYGMGADIADFNNDAHAEIAVVDMAANDHIRDKTLMASMDVEGFWYYVNTLGYQYQYMFNSFQLNNGNGTYSNIAGHLNLLRTDWSWASLLADFDNDGLKDYFVTNGYRRYARDNDFRLYIDQVRRNNGGMVPLDMRDEIYEMMPEIKLPNLIYKNTDELSFEEKSKEWGLDAPTYSNGAAYGDLDGDGDLELVINNIDQQAFVYKNNAIEKGLGNYLAIALSGKGADFQVYTTKVTLKIGDQIQYQEFSPVRGYQGSMDQQLHFGIGSARTVDEIKVEWPNATMTILKNVKANQKLVIRPENTIPQSVPIAEDTPIKPVSSKETGLNFRHKENPFNDFAKEVLLPHKQSALGPHLATADVNDDGLEDVFIGGAAGQSGQLYIQKPDGTFRKATEQPWAADKLCEDMDALFFDADGNGTPDLYIVSGGGGDMESQPQLLADRLYINMGGGKFVKVKIPEIEEAGAVARALDFDLDGDLDIFVGGGAQPGKYPYAAKSYFLRNDGQRFTDVSEYTPKALKNMGMVKDAIVTDINNDKRPDLIVVGEWMPIMIWENTPAGYQNVSEKYGTNDLKGWWYSIAATDIDGDGDEDYIVGNLGSNSKFNASKKKPFNVFAKDFNENGVCDIVLSKEYNGKLVPVRGRQCSSQQMPFIKTKFPTYKSFATASLNEILGDDNLKSALHLQVTTFESIVLLNEGGTFNAVPLPAEAQIAPVNGIEVYDFNEDGKKDLLIAGNNYDTEVETPRYDAGRGLVLLGRGDGTFSTVPVTRSGFYAAGNVKDIKIINKNSDTQKYILVANNNAPLEVFKIERSALLGMK